MKTMKEMMRKALDAGKDWYLVLMDYRNTPIVGLKYSPAQMLTGRRLRGNLPVSDNLLVPHVPTELKYRQARYKLGSCPVWKIFFYNQEACHFAKR